MFCKNGIMNSCFWALFLGACSAPDMGRINPDSAELPEQEPENVRVVAREPIPEGCQVVSLAISEPEDSLDDIIKSLRKEAGKIGGNFVSLETIAYMPSLDSSDEKYATATVYLCE